MVLPIAGIIHSWGAKMAAIALLEVLTLEQFRYVRSLLQMAGIGKTFDFHGSFSSKAAAVKKESETPGAFIRERLVNGKMRYFVLSPKGEK